MNLRSSCVPVVDEGRDVALRPRRRRDRRALPGLELLEARRVPAAITLIQNIGAVADVTPGETSLTIPVTQDVSAGRRVVVELVAAKDSFGGFGDAPVVTDSAGNVYARDYDFDLGVNPPTFSARHQIFSSLIATAIPAGGAITISSIDASFQARAASAQEFYGLDASIPPQPTGGTWNFGFTDLTPSRASGPIGASSLFLASFAILDSPANALTLDPGNVALASAGTTDSAGAWDATIAPAYRVVENLANPVIGGTLDSGAIWGSIGVVYRGDPTERFQVDVTPNASAGEVIDVTVRALDGNGDASPGYTGTVHFTSTDPGANLPDDIHFTPADAGVKTFQVTLTATGLQGIGVQDTVDGTIIGAAEVNIAAGALDHFQIAAPAGTTAGASFSIVVTALDAFNNVIPTYTGTVAFTSTDGQAVVPFPYRFTTGPGGDNGVHTFTGVSLRTAGLQAIAVADESNGTALGSTPVSVSPAAASYFELSGPSTATRGEPFSVTVTARDPFGNVATGFTGLVSFASSDKKASLPLGVLFLPEHQGIASVVITLNSPGMQSITVVDSTGNVAGIIEVVVGTKGKGGKKK